MQTLYRKYRPQSFDAVFGQVQIVKVLQKQIKDKKVGHAYLFSGQRGTGKTSMARLLAKAVNCKRSKSGNPCKKCNSCMSIEKGKFLDMIEIDAASNRGIDEIRRLRERVNFSPSEGEYKVYIIDEVHMLTKDAFNALLKTLEEPPGHVIFILATTEPHKIPSTILSRCQRFNFSLAEDEVIYERLKYICKEEKVDFTKEVLMAIVSNAGGSFRDSESILEKVLGAMGVVKDKKVDFADVKEILGLAEEKEIIEFVEKLLEKNGAGSLKTFDKVASSGVNLFQFIRQVLEYLRKLLVTKVSKKGGEFSLLDLLKIITELSGAESKLRYTQVQRLPIEVAIVKICIKDLDAVSSISSTSSKKEVEKNIPKIVTKVISNIPRKIKKSFKDKKLSKVKIDEVSAKWEKVIEKIQPFNHHLSAFFKKARPIEIKGECIILDVPYRFHKQRIESRRAQGAFKKISQELFGEELLCVCEVTEQDEDVFDANLSTSNPALEVLGDIME
jgi:DNA polymerase-3 subunit gamma/tau